MNTFIAEIMSAIKMQKQVITIMVFCVLSFQDLDFLVLGSSRSGPPDALNLEQLEPTLSTIRLLQQLSQEKEEQCYDSDNDECNTSSQ